jgi:hypothetical protein
MEHQHRMILISVIISAALGLLAGFLGGRLAAPTAAAILQAERFQLVDQNGRVRGQLGVGPQGVARLALFGQDSAMPLVSLAADPQGGANLTLDDHQGQTAMVLTTEPQGPRWVALYYQGKPRLGLEVHNQGEPTVNLYDQDHRLISLGLTSQGDPHLTFYGQADQAALDLVSRKDGDRNLTISGTNGMPRLVLGLKKDQKAALGLFDRQGKTRVALMDEPSLLFLKKGRLLRVLP